MLSWEHTLPLVLPTPHVWIPKPGVNMEKIGPLNKKPEVVFRWSMLVKCFYQTVSWLTVCPAKCSMIGRACNRQLTIAANQWQCCHQECLAGCYGPLDIHCIACVHVMYNGRCMRKCPRGTYEVIDLVRLICHAVFYFMNAFVVIVFSELIAVFCCILED